jgi:hypothetical protein
MRVLGAHHSKSWQLQRTVNEGPYIRALAPLRRDVITCGPTKFFQGIVLSPCWREHHDDLADITRRPYDRFARPEGVVHVPTTATRRSPI